MILEINSDYGRIGNFLWFNTHYNQFGEIFNYNEFIKSYQTVLDVGEKAIYDGLTELNNFKIIPNMNLLDCWLDVVKFDIYYTPPYVCEYITMDIQLVPNSNDNSLL